jgi:hypothetical protein
MQKLGRQSVEIVVDPATLDQSTNGSITGVIALQGQGWSYPERGWSDFPVVILQWWLQAVQDVSTRLGGTAPCRFMDGPYAFQLVSLTPSDWRLECLARYETGIEQEVHIQAEQFQASLQRAALDVAQGCRRLGWQSRDLDTLEALFGLPRGGAG